MTTTINTLYKYYYFSAHSQGTATNQDFFPTKKERNPRISSLVESPVANNKGFDEDSLWSPPRIFYSGLTLGKRIKN